MPVVTAIILYVVIWWVTIFIVLPLDIKEPEHKVRGMMPGAPAAPAWRRKLILNSILAGIIWVVIFAVVNSNLISFQDMAARMPL